ncbi:MAG: DUF1934 domain-containing protein [Clostridia bacterium]|nr:DUF1934 domain-containing protein [Clostridia bacterium]
MEKKMFLKIQGNRMQDGEEEKVEFVTEAMLRCEGEGYCLEYNESSVTGMEGTKTMIFLRPNEVSIARVGRNNSHLMLEPGKKHVTLYETEAGVLSMGVSSDRVHVEMTETGGQAEFDYHLEINDVPTSDNYFCMKVWEV